MNIIFISQYFRPDITAAAFRVSETVDLLRDKGHQVTVITTYPHKGIVDNATAKISSEKWVVRVPILQNIRGTKRSYLIHYFSFMVSSIWAGLRFSGRPDVVIATSPPLFVGISGWFVSRLKKTKFILDIRDIWPDSAVTTGQLPEKSIYYRLAKRVEKWLYHQADLITCVARPMAEYIGSIAPDTPLRVIYNGVPEKYINPSFASVNSMIRLKHENINIVYIGNMGYCQRLDLVLDAARILSREGDSRFMFYLVGDGIEKLSLTEKIEEEKLDNIIISGPVDKSEAFFLIHHASALFINLRQDSTMEKTIPSKVFDYMTGGRPILFGIKGEGRKILQQVQGNLEIKTNECHEFITKLKLLANNLEELTLQAKHNNIVIKKYYTREVLTNIFDHEISNILS